MLHRLYRLVDPYILLMIATVLVAAVAPAQGRGVFAANAVATGGILFLFFLYGTRLSPAAAVAGLRHWQLHLTVLFSTFAIFPVLGIVFQRIAPGLLPPALSTGILFLCLLPSTVQSSIAFTSIARGNVPAALCAASASNILGVAITPALAGWMLHAQGAHFTPAMFRDVVLQLMAPFVAGQLLRPYVGEWIAGHKQVLGLANRGSILLIIYVAFSKGVADGVWHQIGGRDLLVLLTCLLALLALILVATAVIGRRLLRLSVEDEIVVQFCGSKKSLASGLPMATILFPGPQLSLVVLPLMLFHQLQLLVCAVLARRYARRPAADAVSASVRAARPHLP